MDSEPVWLPGMDALLLTVVVHTVESVLPYNHMPFRKNSTWARLLRCARFVLATDILTIKACPIGPEESQGNLLMSVPKKIGSAPVRNRIRRRFREIFRTSTLKHYYHLLIFIRKPLETTTHQELQELFQQVAQKLTTRSERLAQ
jgi:ribonuclease P protein component